ncbi:TadE/TadG family type IV pilus assembly protein [Ornithinibacillus xuwenensis]|uniref:Pilus assembly protein n=1 Tax=Ornithinibacillus xuwenensis TaxID=3144668 RepID=A0ABU9XK80_9BACI
MNWLRKIKRSEEGSATIEFLGIIPIALLFMMIIWQFIVGINAVIVTQSAINEYAEVYSVTKNKGEAQAAAQEIINATGDYLTFNSFVTEPTQYDKEFTAEIAVNIRLILIPELFGDTIQSIDYNATAYGRVIE